MNAHEDELGEAGNVPPGRSVLDRFCDTVDAINRWLGPICGLGVLAVVAAVVYEVVARSLFNKPTIWSNETAIYLSAMIYLLAGGYALLYRSHVRIDIVYERLPPRPRARLDALTFVFFFIYVGAIIWIGSKSAWASYLQHETTGTPWNPPIWPVRFAIPISGLLLLLQGTANLLRDTGIARQENAR